MKKSLIIFLVLFLLICGCNKTNESDNLVEHPIINTKENILSGKLVISVPMYWGSIVNIVHQFKELHPNVEFEIRSSNKEGEYFTDIRTFDDYVIQMATDVMSATDVDIYETGYLPYYKYSESDAFENLFEYMNNDQNFNINDYYTNVFESLSSDGKLFLLPHHFGYQLFRLNRNNSIEYDEETPGMSYEELDGLYNNAIVAHPEKNISFSLNNTANSYDFNKYELSGQINLNSKQIITNIDGFKKYLDFEKCRLFWGQSEEYPYDYVDTDSDLGEWFMNVFPFGLKTVNDATSQVSKPFLLTPSNGSLCFSPIGGLFSISAHSKNKELSWEFLKFMIEEKDYPFDSCDIDEYEAKIETYISSVSINRNNFIKTANQILKKRFNRDVTEDVDFWNHINESVNHTLFSDYKTYDIIYEIISDFNHDLITKDECIRLLKDKSNIYLQE